MADLVDAGDIERIVGARRHRKVHIGLADPAQGEFYILHSGECVGSGIDLRECAYSRALDRGADPEDWAGFEDRPVFLDIVEGRLRPMGVQAKTEPYPLRIGEHEFSVVLDRTITPGTFCLQASPINPGETTP